MKLYKRLQRVRGLFLFLYCKVSSGRYNNNNDKNDKKTNVISLHEITIILKSLGINKKTAKKIVNDAEFLSEKAYTIITVSANKKIEDKAAYIATMYEHWKEFECDDPGITKQQ